MLTSVAMKTPHVYRSHGEVLALWESYSELSRELSAQGNDISPMGVARWGQAEKIPPVWFGPLVRAAKARGFHGVDLETLHSLIPSQQEPAA